MIEVWVVRTFRFRRSLTMRAMPVLPLALGLSLGLAASWLPAARAANDGEKVKFDTGDGVELHGVYYASDRGKRAPAVLLLHKIGGKSDQDGWDKLAKELNGAGCSVLSFDLRGHGDSTTVDPKVFWAVPDNQKWVKGFNAARPKDSISYKDFATSYYPVLVNDVVAAKLFLDKQNDLGTCNSANTIVIGAEDGATLGLMWMASEQCRYRAINPNPLVANPLLWKYDSSPEGKDVAAAIWLSLSPSLGSQGAPMQSWLRSAKAQKVHMAFLYGAEDSTAEGHAKNWLGLVKPEKKDVFTLEKGIAKTKLAGSQLLGEKLETVGDITNYVKNFMKENQGNDYDKKSAEDNTYVWKFPSRISIAKTEKEKVLNPLPVGELMR
jgi:pimeloyl-ACP methyl ester carboxylesterase